MSTLTVIKRTSSFLEKGGDETLAVIEYQDSNRVEKLDEAINLAKQNTERQWVTCLVLDSGLELLHPGGCSVAWDTGACFAVEYGD